MAKRFLQAWVSSTVALLGSVALFNLLVDPYGLFHLVDIEGFNRIKSEASGHAEMFKRYAARRMGPKTLILGNSRAEVGFDPESKAWPPALRPVFNFALPGKGVETALAEFTGLLDSAKPQFVLVGVDFRDFLVDPGSDDDVAAQPADRWGWLRERLLALSTVEALVDSLATVKAQHEAYPRQLSKAGFNPMRDYVRIARTSGYNVMFRQRDAENARAYARGAKTIYHADGQLASEFRALERLVRIAGEHGVTVRLVVYPYHAHTLVLFHLTGLWPAFEAWKHELVKLVERTRTGTNVELWDFSSFSPYANEEVPPPGDTGSDLSWYWEAGHFKKSLGDIVLARLLDPQGSPAQWGRRLSAQNLEEQRELLRAARDDYERTHSRDVAVLAGLVDAGGAGSQVRDASGKLRLSE